MDTETLSTRHRSTVFLHLAREIRSRFDPRNIESVAAASDIVLVRSSGPENREAGFAYIEYVRRPVFVESLSHPEEPIRVWGRSRLEPLRSIVLNTNSGIPEWEIFWHEYYHLFYSPQGLQHGERFEHHYSTEGVLHSREERRADEFAAAVLAPELVECGPKPNATAAEIAEEFDMSERLVQRAIALLSYSLQSPEGH